MIKAQCSYWWLGVRVTAHRRDHHVRVYSGDLLTVFGVDVSGKRQDVAYGACLPSCAGIR
jgi:hypothetical protein